MNAEDIIEADAMALHDATGPGPPWNVISEQAKEAFRIVARAQYGDVVPPGQA